MRIVAAVPILLVLVACGPSAHTREMAAEEPAHISLSHLTIGMPKYRDNEDAASLKAFADYLSRTFGVRVEIRMEEPYQTLPVLLRTGAVDIAELPPLAYARLHDQDPRVLPIATSVISGNPTYLGHLYVKADSRFHLLSDLQGARIGYVNPDSTSGYLFPRDVLRRKGFDPDTFFSSSRFFGSHPKVLDAIASGEIDVGAAEDVTSEWLGPIQRPEGLRVIMKTDRIPNDCMAARPGLDQQTRQAILRALEDLHPPVPDAPAILSAIGVNGWIAGDEARYDRVRLVLQDENAARKR